MLGLLLFIIGAFYHIMLQLLIVQEKPYSYSVFSIYSSSITLLVGVILAKYLNLRITGLFIGYIGSLAIGLPILFNFSIARYKCRTFLSSMSAEMLRYGLPLVATNISNWVLRLSDRYIIEFYKGSHEVGLYSISYTVAEGSIQILITLIFLSSAPKAMKIWESEGAESARCYITRLTRSFLILVIPATIGLALLAKPILMILSNVKYIEGHAIMPLISVSMLVFGLQRNFQLGLLFHKKTRLIMYSLICSALINIVLNFIFVPRFGFIAAGYTTLSSYIAMSVMIATLSRSYFVWKFPFRTLSRVLISTACMAIVIILGSRYIKVEYGMIQLVIIILGAIVSYFGMLLLMRELKIDVLMRAKKIIQRDEE
jgi:O-antigen/teichoic acid export membrane protein